MPLRARWFVGFALILAGCGRASDKQPEAPTGEPAATPALAAPEPAAEQAPASKSKADDQDEPKDSLGRDREGTLGAAIAEFDRAQGELEVALGTRFAQPPPAPVQPSAPSGAGNGSGAPAPRTRAPAADKASRKESEEGRAAEKKSEDPCVTVCRAFQSLTRSASAVCRLDGDGGSRCSRAKGIVAEAEPRVKSCGCK